MMNLFAPLQKKISIPLWIPFLFLLMAYPAWEIYWFTQVGLAFIKWHTHFMVLGYLWLAGMWLLRFAGDEKQRENYALSFSVLMFMLLAAELGLHITGFNKTYLEKRSNQYQSLYGNVGKDSVRAYSPLQEYQLKTPEYNYPRKSNSMGFGDEEWIADTSKILIQTYGDSFTEGDGAPVDSSYPAILRTLLGENFQVQNYGICGNDPGFYVPQFDKVGSRFQPDAMVLCYGTGDLMADFFSKGGLERFDKGGWRSRPGPWWEVVYGISYLSRLLFHAFGIEYGKFFLSDKNIALQLKAMEPQWNNIFAEIGRLAQAHNTKVLLFKKPERSEIVRAEYQYNMAFFDTFLLQHPIFHHVDLMPFYRDSAGLVSHETTAPYYWEKDGHHNGKGYAVMARGVHSALLRDYLINTK